MIGRRFGRAGPSWPMVRLGGLLVVSAVVLAAFFWPPSRPPAVRPIYTGSPGPTFNLPAALDSPVDAAGLMRNGGIWAVQGSYLLTSVDNGETWRAGIFQSSGLAMAPGNVFVLDPLHAWSVESGGVEGGLASQGPGHLFTVRSTADGGKTWRSTAVSGEYRCPSATLSFVDATHGFVMCSVGSEPGPAGPVDQSRAGAIRGSGTVLRTDDGGASWNVAGSGVGLGSQFTASDTTTLWSAPDHLSSQRSGAALYVSRDSGATWSSVELPGLASLPANTPVDFQAGPLFWDASNGAFAVSVSPCCSGDSPEIWFYRTSDAGKSWNVVKTPKRFLDPLLADNAAVGRAWAIVGDSTLFSLRVSGDFGTSWTDGQGFGMPDNTTFLSLDLIDQTRAVATVFAFAGKRALMLTVDGGRTWHAADFGDARTKVPADPGQDPVQAKATAEDFETMAGKYPPNAWNQLSSYSQRLFGSETAFESVEGALFARTAYSYRLGDPTRDTSVLSPANLGAPIWADLVAFANMPRAYAIVVTFPGSAEPAQTLVVAPLTVTGDWRVWLVSAPPATTPS